VRNLSSFCGTLTMLLNIVTLLVLQQITCAVAHNHFLCLPAPIWSTVLANVLAQLGVTLHINTDLCAGRSGRLLLSQNSRSRSCRRTCDSWPTAPVQAPGRTQPKLASPQATSEETLTELGQGSLCRQYPRVSMCMWPKNGGDQGCAYGLNHLSRWRPLRLW
jgi:hypothetical protein